MKHWVFTARVEPPPNTTISIRFGASVMFGAYSPVTRQWLHVYPGGEEKIPEPPMWFCDEQWAKDHQREKIGSIVRRAGVRIGQKEKTVQLSLF